MMRKPKQLSPVVTALLPIRLLPLVPLLLVYGSAACDGNSNRDLDLVDASAGDGGSHARGDADAADGMEDARSLPRRCQFDCAGKDENCTTLGFSICGASGSCVACRADDDCRKAILNTGKCDVALGTCSRCESADDCAGTRFGPFCDTAAGRCYACESDSDCTKGLRNTGKCNVTVGSCDRCDGHDDCHDTGLGLYCEAGTKQCIACRGDSDCIKDSANTGKCDVASGTCVSCEADRDCATLDDTLRCDLETSRCVECLEHSDCRAGEGQTALCVDNRCLGCEEERDCDAAFDPDTPWVCTS